MINLEDFLKENFSKTHFARILEVRTYKPFLALIYQTTDNYLKFKIFFWGDKDKIIKIFNNLQLISDGGLLDEQKAKGVVFEFKNKKIEKNGKDFWDIEILGLVKNYKNQEFKQVDKYKYGILLDNLEKLEERLLNRKNNFKKDIFSQNDDFEKNIFKQDDDFNFEF